MKILFLLSPFNKPDKTSYQHNCVCLAEGFRQLGICFLGNINYWWEIEKSEYLIKAAPKGYCSDINIYDSSYFKNYPEKISSIERSKINVLIDMSDGLNTSCFNKGFENFKLILRSQYVSFFKYPKNVKPWAFGLSERMINAIDVTRNNKFKSPNEILINYRVPHGLRDLINSNLNNNLGKKFIIRNIISDSLERKVDNSLLGNFSYWAQTGRRHDIEYYRQLNAFLITYCFGGEFVLKPLQVDGMRGKLMRKFYLNLIALNNKLGRFSRTSFNIYQFDSWRLWEAFYSASVPLHLDFYRFGFILPEMPENGEHYLGLKSFNFKKESIRIIRLSENKLREISSNGREWVYKNYCPKAVAMRLINLLIS